MMEELINEFQIASDDGICFTVREYRQVIPAGSMQDPGGTILGKLVRFEADGRYPVNLRDDGTYEVVERGLIARRVV